MRPVSRELADLRLGSEAAAREEDWTAFLSRTDRLRDEDPAWWPHLWAPLAAVAAHGTGGDALGYLREAIRGGFRQPELLPLEPLRELPDWPQLWAAMSGPVLPPAIEVGVWPTVTYGPPLVLDRLALDREPLLRQRLPSPGRSAWATARTLLEWATAYWEHANDHVDSADAVDVLDRADAGERFACVEYSVVLSQALNVVGIPARRVSLLMRDQHVGFGRGHVVSEAWIDDLRRWVVLDGQNGAWWGSVDEPLGLRDLQAIEHGAGPRPDMCLTVRDITPQDQETWWTYFHAASSSGLKWCERLVPIFQGEAASARLVVPPTAATHPDLTGIETGVADGEGGPGLVFTPVHPYAIGTLVGETQLEPGQPFELETLPPGQHGLGVSTLTAYGTLSPQSLQITRR
ncbi:MAG: transglutaminase domain-containing protein [Nocardioidaceae bacterium]